MHLLSLLTVSLLRFTSGGPPQKSGVLPQMKVMFFGDSTVSGIHNSESDICPFRYDFLRSLKKDGKEVTVVGTNTDREDACQKAGEGLSLSNNGYQNAQVAELLDYITADLQYLGNPVDYIFTSIGLQDCLQWKKGRDFQILSQQVRRIMGRLLNLNENAKIYHIPLMLPPSADKLSVDCVNSVNKKLRDVYDPEKNHGRIRVIDPLHEQALTEDMFWKLGGSTVKATDVNKTKAQATKPRAHSVDPKLPSANSTAEVRRLNQLLEYLPNDNLNKMISKELIKTLDWKFRAQTPTPTMAVTKPDDYYGYTWCLTKYEKEMCFEYYYGYVWCLERYTNEECYKYYYGDLDNWEEKDSYKWCLNFYDEEYCSFAYKGQEPDTWDWLSFGYNDCLQTKDNNKCFEQYYGYAWCVYEYSDFDCYEYYYGGEDWVWDEKSNYKWCLNFYTDDECKAKYVITPHTIELETQQASYLFGFSPITVVLFVLAIAGIFLFCCRRNLCCFEGKKEYVSIPRYSGEDERSSFTRNII